jgi:hypothetical protein
MSTKVIPVLAAAGQPAADFTNVIGGEWLYRISAAGLAFRGADQPWLDQYPSRRHNPIWGGNRDTVKDGICASFAMERAP